MSNYIVREPDSEDEKNNQLVLHNTAPNPLKQKIQRILGDHHEISKKLEKVLDISSKIEFDDDCKIAQTFVDQMQNHSKELVKTQAALRQCVQTVRAIFSFKPIKCNDPDQETRWQKIHDYSDSVRANIRNVMDIMAEWFGYLDQLRFGLVYFYTTMSNENGTPSNAIRQFQAAAKRFTKFQKDNAKQYITIREKSEKTMADIAKTFDGGDTIRDAQKTHHKRLQTYSDEMDKLKQLQLNEWGEIRQLKKEIARLQGELEFYDVQLRYANNEISNLDRAIKDNADSARRNEREAESATNYKREMKTSNMFGWNLYNFWSNVETGDKDSLRDSADRYRQIQDKEKSEKDAKVKIEATAQQQKAETLQKIEQKRREYDEIKKLWDDRIVQQVKEVQNAKARCDDDFKIMEEAVNKFGVKQPWMTQFLTAADNLSQQSWKVIEQTKNIDVTIETLSNSIISICQTTVSVEACFTENNLIPLIDEMKNNEVYMMTDIECEDEKEYKTLVLPIIDKIANPIQKRKVKSLCVDSHKIKDRKALAKTNIDILWKSVRPLVVCFPVLYNRLKFCNVILQIQDASDDNEIVSIIENEVRDFEQKDVQTRKSYAIKEAKIRAISWLPDDDEKKQKFSAQKPDRLSNSSIDDEKVLTRETLTLKKVIRNNLVRCIDDDYEKITFSVDENKSAELKQLLETGEQRKIDVKLDVTRVNIGKTKPDYTINKAYMDESNDNEQILTLKELIDDDMLEFIGENGETDVLDFDEDKWHEKLSVLEQQSKEQKRDVKLKVSVVNTGKKMKYTIIDAYLEGNNANGFEIFTLKKIINGKYARCVSDDSQKINIRIDEERAAELQQKMDVVNGTQKGDVKLKVSVNNTGSNIEYTIIEQYIHE